MHSLDHLGLATPDADALTDLLETLIGGRRFASETVAEQGVEAHFLPAATPGATPPTLELLEPADLDDGSGEAGPVARFLEKRGPGMHHLALHVADVEAAMAKATEHGVRLLSDEPRPGARGKRVAFLHPKDTGGILVELCEHTDALPEAIRVPFTHDGAEGTLAAYTLGNPENPPLLLLHGAAGCSRLETRPLLHRLAPHFHVVALDFPGHGASDAFAETPFSSALFSESARAALGHFGFAEAAVFGFSMGGYMALHLARQHPERVRRLALHGACIEWTDARVEAMTARLDADAIRQRNGRAVRALDAAHGDWAALFSRTAEFVRLLPARTEEMQALAARIETPTLVSAADRDDLFPLEAPLSLHRRLPKARLAVVPGRRHALAQVNLGALVPPLARHLRA